MPLVIDGGRIPTAWTVRKSSQAGELADSKEKPTKCVSIAFVNNMPDPALEDTEMQFFELLDAAAGNISVNLKLYSLPEIPRSDRAQKHLSNFYFGLEDLWNSKFDGMIVTGTEPHQSNLRDEPYWTTLVNVLEWGERNTVSTVLSCLAAHAGVLHSDGIDRHALSDKLFGVFDYKKIGDHLLMSNVADLIRIPHSRWNEVREDALTSCGYVVLAKSAEAGVDLFMKQKRKSLFVHLQGHLEYRAGTLSKEYRRDIKRFLRQERKTYPSMPQGYFDAATAKLLNDFRENALSHPSEELLASFPEALVAGTLQNTWHSSATCVYRNWLRYVVSKKADTSYYSAIATEARSSLQ